MHGPQSSPNELLCSLWDSCGAHRSARLLDWAPSQISCPCHPRNGILYLGFYSTSHVGFFRLLPVYCSLQLCIAVDFLLCSAALAFSRGIIACLFSRTARTMDPVDLVKSFGVPSDRHSHNAAHHDCHGVCSKRLQSGVFPQNLTSQLGRSKSQALNSSCCAV